MAKAKASVLHPDALYDVNSRVVYINAMINPSDPNSALRALGDVLLTDRQLNQSKIAREVGVARQTIWRGLTKPDGKLRFDTVIKTAYQMGLSIQFVPAPDAPSKPIKKKKSVSPTTE